MPSGIYIRTKEHRIATSKAGIGRHYKLSEETKQKMSVAKKGIPSHWKNKTRGKFTEEHKNKLRIPRRGSGNHKSLKGELNPRWIKDRTLIKRQKERNNPNDKQWKYSVYKRDNFKCRITDENCSGKIEAHHILPWRDYPELRFNINNGITLCHAHHPRKRAEEKRLEPYFTGLVSVSKE